MAISEEQMQRIYDLSRRLYITRSVIDTFIKETNDEEQYAYLKLLEDEFDHRHTAKKTRLLRRAKLPCMKSFKDFDYSHIDFPDGFSQKDLESLDFINRGEGFVFLGQTGRGKTHLSIAIALAAIEQLKRTYFTTAAKLVFDLAQAEQEGKLTRMLKDLSQLDLLIIDELGYVPINQEGSKLLFQVIADCYETHSLIVTTNIEFSRWGYVFGDDKLAAAAIDRIIHHNRLVEFKGESHRVTGSLMLEGRQPMAAK